MIKSRFLNTVTRKYSWGYIIALSFLIVSFSCFLFTSIYLSGQYSRSSDSLARINQLETGFTGLNEDVSMAYSFLSSDGVQKYREDSVSVKEILQQVEEMDTGYDRDRVDLTKSIESYLSISGDLIGSIDSYISGQIQTSGVHDSLDESYSETQEAYSYINVRFQNAYRSSLRTMQAEYDRLSGFQHRMYIALAVMLCVFVAVCILYIVRVIRGVSDSISRMMSGVNALEENIRTAEPIEMHSNDEFEKLADAFNRMQGMLQRQMMQLEEDSDVRERLVKAENENLRIYGELQKNHLAFLQSRINPHFLFNTLNMISAQAEIEGAQKSAELMEITASYLRYNLDNISKTVTLEKEVENLNDYIAIQKYRYDDRFLFEFRINPGTLALAMPCMVLQPLVENSIQHGIGMMTRGGKVTVGAIEKEGYVELTVTDNGVGMTEQQIQAVEKNLQENNTASRHIGLRNIYRRLQLFYQDDVSMSFRAENPGLSIRIRVPYMRLEQYEAKDGNSG